MKSLTKIFGVAGLCVLTACSPNTEVNITEESYSDLLDEPDFSYRIFPYTNIETQQPTGHFALLVKEAQTINQNAFDKNGNRGVQTCGAFRTIESAVNDKGQISIKYFGSIGMRSATYETEYVPVDLSKDTIDRYETEIRGNYVPDLRLESGQFTFCEFTPT